MRGPVAYRLRGGSRRLWRQFQSEHGPTAPGTLFAERSCARSSTSGDVCIRRRSALRWVQGHRRSRLCVCEGVAPIMGAGSTRGRPAGVGTGRPGRKTRGLLHVCGVRKLRFDETAPFCTTDELKQPVGVSGPLGAGARAVTGALDRVFASTDDHATCSNVVIAYVCSISATLHEEIWRTDSHHVTPPKTTWN